MVCRENLQQGVLLSARVKHSVSTTRYNEGSAHDRKVGK